MLIELLSLVKLFSAKTILLLQLIASNLHAKVLHIFLLVQSVIQDNKYMSYRESWTKHLYNKTKHVNGDIIVITFKCLKQGRVHRVVHGV